VTGLALTAKPLRVKFIKITLCMSQKITLSGLLV
jgi:hypothetical protein